MGLEKLMVCKMFHNSITVQGDTEGGEEDGGGRLLDPAVALRVVHHAAACRALHLHEAHIQVGEGDIRQHQLSLLACFR